MRVFLVSIRDPRVRFEVLDYDPELRVGKLKGPTGSVFIRDISKKACEKYGYRKVVIDAPKNVPRKQSDGED